LEKGLLGRDPFVSIDASGVGRMVHDAVRRCQRDHTTEGVGKGATTGVSAGAGAGVGAGVGPPLQVLYIVPEKEHRNIFGLTVHEYNVRYFVQLVNVPTLVTSDPQLFFSTNRWAFVGTTPTTLTPSPSLRS